jgi:hypothetical protein
MALSRKRKLLQSRKKLIGLTSLSFPCELICADIALLHMVVAMVLSEHLLRASLPPNSTQLLASQAIHSCHAQSPPRSKSPTPANQTYELQIPVQQSTHPSQQLPQQSPQPSQHAAKPPQIAAMPLLML